jgi:glycosyltransferase involved in cell wall biosynthesis
MIHLQPMLMPTSKLRTVVFVAAQFPPSNLTAGHRTRLFVRHLPEFGYRPIVLTMRGEDYEEHLDPDLERLVLPGLEVIRTKALPTRPVRLVGDHGIRSFPFHLTAIGELARKQRIDLLYIPVPPNYSSLLGPLVKRMYGIPYAIDYIDPWIYPVTCDERPSWKARVSRGLARVLEPMAVAGASGVTGVAPEYYAGVLARHPQLRLRPSAGIPYGGEALDHQALARNGPRSSLLDQEQFRGKVVLVYAGALLPRAHGTLRALLRACRQWVDASADGSLAHKLSLLFVGTGARPTDPTSGLVAPIARECGAEALVTEVAERQPYLDVLALLHRAHGVLILGSTDAGYTASKTFQALHSGRPILALLHAGSSASSILQGMPGARLVTFTDDQAVETRTAEIEAGLRAVAAAGPDPAPRDLSLLEPYSAREMSRKLAAFFDDVLAGARPSPSHGGR